MLDLNANQVSVDVQRDQGFLEGFGIDVGDKNQIGDETDPRIVGHDVTDGAEDGGRTAMENLLQKDPSINLVYTINEPAAAGAYQALKAAGKEKDVTIVSVDGGCPGVEDVKAGHRRHLAAVPAEDGVAGRRGDRGVRQGRHQAAGDRGQELHRHRRHADHRPAAGRGGLQGLRLRRRRTAGAEIQLDRPVAGAGWDEAGHRPLIPAARPYGPRLHEGVHAWRTTPTGRGGGTTATAPKPAPTGFDEHKTELDR